MDLRTERFSTAFCLGYKHFVEEELYQTNIYYFLTHWSALEIISLEFTAAKGRK